MKASKLRADPGMAKDRRISAAQHPYRAQIGTQGEALALIRRVFSKRQALEYEAGLRRTDPVYARD